MMLLAPVTNWELPGVTLAGYCYAMRYGMKVQIISLYHVSHNVMALRYAVKLQVCTHLNRQFLKSSGSLLHNNTLMHITPIAFQFFIPDISH
jgi:hypothetical protein